jgi:hypothetical protein
LRHLAYATGWKKFEPLWDLIIRARQAMRMLPLLELILEEFGQQSSEGINRNVAAGAHAKEQIESTLQSKVLGVRIFP